MAKKKKLESKAPVPLTRGQLSRAERERRQIRSLYTAGVALGALVVLIIGFSVIYTYIVRPSAEVASVNGTTIKRATYNKLRRWNLFQNLQTAAFQRQFGQATSFESPEQLTAKLKTVEEDPLDADTVNQLINDEVLRQKSSGDFGINPDQQTLKQEAVKEFIPQPTQPPAPTSEVSGSPTVTGTVTITPTATSTPTPGSPTATATPSATLPPVPGAERTAEATYSQYISAIGKSIAPQQGDPFCGAGCPELSESDYLTLVIEPRVRRNLVIEKLAATSIVTAVEQINVQHILTDTQEAALKIKEQLDKGADFTELANTQSKEQIDNINQGLKPNGGNLGWTPREGASFVKEFIEGAWPVQAGRYSDPVQTTFGWHIIKVLERDPKRPLSDSQIENLKNKAYEEWFQKGADSSAIRSSVPRPTAIPTQPPLVEPTPVGQPTVQGSATAPAPAGATAPVTGTTAVTPTVGINPSERQRPQTTPTANPTPPSQ